MKKYAIWILSAIAVIIIFQLSYGLRTLLPDNISWLMTARHDWGTHYLGWAFYKGEPWGFPLGKIVGYNYPVGTNVGYTDSIPLLAIFFKLFSPLLSSDFQYFGIWLFLCHILAAYFTILLCRVFKVNWIVTLAASIFIASSPVLLYRGMHPALCGQWMLIAGIYFYFLDRQSSNWKKILLYQYLLLCFSATINPYLCAMVMGFSFATSIKLCFYKKYISWKYLVIYIAVSLCSVLLLWYITGMVSFGNQENFGIAGAYGLYGLNLNSLFNPVGYSPLLPQMKQVSWHQYEGFMYLGVGMLLLLIVFILYSIYAYALGKVYKDETVKTRPTRDSSNLPLWILIIAYTVFSITLVITYNDKVLFRIPAPEIFKRLEEIFRASARFFWTPYYLIILFTIIGFAKSRINPIISTSLIVLALTIQVYDLNRLLRSKYITYGVYNPPMKSANWINLMRRFDRILFFPAFNTPKIRGMAYQDFCYLALKANKPVNLGYVARENPNAIKLFRDSLSETVANGLLSPNNLYITDSANLPYFSKAILSYSAIVDSLDGCFYVFAIRQENISKNDSLQLKSKRILNTVLEKSGIVGFAETDKLPIVTDVGIRYNIESSNIGKSVISMSGWAFIDTSHNNVNDSIFVCLNSADRSYFSPVRHAEREDVAEAFNRPNLANSGLNLLAFTDNLKPGIYQLSLAIKDVKGRFVAQPLGREVRIKKSEFVTPLKITALPTDGKVIYDLIIEEDDVSFSAKGWAALANQDADSNSINLILKNDENIYVLPTEPYLRPDVTASFNNKYKMDNSGFNVKFLKDVLPKGIYRVGFLIQNQWSKIDKIFFTEKEIRIKKVEFTVPLKIVTLPTEGNIVYDLIFEESTTSYSFKGWAALKNQDADSCVIHLILKDNKNIYLLATESYYRPDVTASFRKQFNLDNSGYGVSFLKENLPPGKYRVGLLIKDLRLKTESVRFTEKEIKHFEEKR
jgi:hypothetical protein